MGGFFLTPAEGQGPSGPKVILPDGRTIGRTTGLRELDNRKVMLVRKLSMRKINVAILKGKSGLAGGARAKSVRDRKSEFMVGRAGKRHNMCYKYLCTVKPLTTRLNKCPLLLLMYFWTSDGHFAALG